MEHHGTEENFYVFPASHVWLPLRPSWIVPFLRFVLIVCNIHWHNMSTYQPFWSVFDIRFPKSWWIMGGYPQVIHSSGMNFVLRQHSMYLGGSPRGSPFKERTPTVGPTKPNSDTTEVEVPCRLSGRPRSAPSPRSPSSHWDPCCPPSPAMPVDGGSWGQGDFSRRSRGEMNLRDNSDNWIIWVPTCANMCQHVPTIFEPVMWRARQGSGECPRNGSKTNPPHLKVTSQSHCNL